MQYHPPNASWPNPDIMKTIPFDYTIHDPKYDDISSVYSPGYKSSAEGRRSHNRQSHVYSQNIFIFSKCLLLGNQSISSQLPLYCAFVLTCLCPCCLSKERLFVRRMCTYAGGHLGSSCLNMQPTTPTTIVNSVISTWVSTLDIR